MRRALLVLATVAGGMVVAACGSNEPMVTVTATHLAALQKQADMYQIDQIEVTWHRAASTHDVPLMMTIWANNATLQLGTTAYVGTAKIRSFWATSAAPFFPTNKWVDETPAYKARITVSGNTGTLYFECHFVDVATSKVVGLAATTAYVARINGQWLITSSIGSTPTLSP